jgi:tetratricopeptide (TPR) repeat protein
MADLLTARIPATQRGHGGIRTTSSCTITAGVDNLATASPNFRRRKLLVVCALALAAVLFAALLLWAGPVNLWWPRAVSAFGDKQAALAAVEKIHPPTTASRLLRARLLYETSNYSACSSAYLEVGPESPDDLVKLGRSLAREGRWSESIPILEAAKEQDRLSIEVCADLADGYASLGDYKTSREFVEQLEQLGARGQALYRHGLLDHETNRPQAFVQRWQELLRIADQSTILPRPLDEIRVDLAAVCVAEGMFDDAETAIQGAPVSAKQQQILGDLSEADGDSEDAVTYWESASKLDPNLAAPRESLARSLLQRNKYEEALAVLEPLAGDALAWSAQVCNIFQLVHTGLGNSAEASLWQERRESALQQAENLSRLMRLVAVPGSPHERAIRAWKHAATGNIRQAQLIVEAMENQIPADAGNAKLVKFVRALAVAIRRSTELPDPAQYLLPDDEAADATEGDKE